MRNISTRHKHFALNALEANKIAKFEHRCNEFHSDFVPLALETYGGTSERFEKVLEKLTSKAAEFNNIPYPILLTTGRKVFLLHFKLAMCPSCLKLIVASLILEQKHCCAIMIGNVLSIKCFSNQK